MSRPLRHATAPGFAVLTFAAAVSAGSLFGQVLGISLPPSGNNQKASVTQFIGPVMVTIEYSSPAVHGPDGKDRRGEIWGKLVPYGMAPLGFGNGKPGPWRAGANENTVFAVSNDVVVEGKTLPAGRYGLHVIPGPEPNPEEWTIIFSKNSTSWGSFFYEESEDSLRVSAKPHKHEYREWLTYDFTVRRPSEATVELQWEDLALPWTIKVADVNSLYLSRIRSDLRTTPGFAFENYRAAAEFCLRINANLEEGLRWAEAAVSMPFIGQETFSTLSTKSKVLAKLGRSEDAKRAMDSALHLPTADPKAIHQYGRQLLTEKKTSEAMKVFEWNARKNGEVWPTHVGLARGYLAQGDNQKALELARKALEQAPDKVNRDNLQAMVDALSQGKPFNQ